MDTAQWPQEIMVKPMEEIVTNTCSSSAAKNITSKTTSNSIERKVRPLKDQALNCPRCNSTNTKFCYYNNYSLSQPRYFCKTCRRYWTEGGSLRNIPVGGGSRKNKRSFSSNSSASSLINPSKKLPDLIPPPSLVSCSDTQSLTQNPKIHHGQDLNLGYPTTHEFRSLSEFIQLPINMEGTPEGQIHASTVNGAASSHLSALELLNGITSSRGMMSSFVPMSVSDPGSGSGYSSGFQLPPDFKPVASLNFTLDGIGNGNGFGSLQLGGVGEVQDEANVNGRLLFPFEDLRQQVSSTSTSADHNNNNSNGAEQHREHGDSSGYWNGMLSGGGGGGGSW